MSDLYEDAILYELAHWPGVAVEFGRRSKHRQATFRFGEASRFIVMPDSPSDTRGHLNCVRDVRKELVALGAARLERKRPTARKRPPVRRKAPRLDTWAAHVPRAPIKANPFDVLASVTFATEPPRLSFWRRLWNWLVA